MARAKKARHTLSDAPFGDVRERVEDLADEAKKAFVRSVRPVERRVETLAGDARKALARSVRPVEKRAGALRRSLRQTAAGWLHEAARVLTRAEKLVAPPAPAKRARRKRAKAKPAVHSMPATGVTPVRAEHREVNG